MFCLFCEIQKIFFGYETHLLERSGGGGGGDGSGSSAIANQFRVFRQTLPQLSSEASVLQARYGSERYVGYTES